MQPREVVKAWVETFNRGDADELAGFYAEDAVNHQVANEPVVGRTAVLAMMFKREFANAHMVCEIENLFEDGQWAILEWRHPKGLRGCGFFHINEHAKSPFNADTGIRESLFSTMLSPGVLVPNSITRTRQNQFSGKTYPKQLNTLGDHLKAPKGSTFAGSFLLSKGGSLFASAEASGNPCNLRNDNLCIGCSQPSRR